MPDIDADRNRLTLCHARRFDLMGGRARVPKPTEPEKSPGGQKVRKLLIPQCIPVSFGSNSLHSGNAVFSISIRSNNMGLGHRFFWGRGDGTRSLEF